MYEPKMIVTFKYTIVGLPQLIILMNFVTNEAQYERIDVNAVTWFQCLLK